VSIRNNFIRNTRNSPGVFAGATSTRGKQVARRTSSVASAKARAIWVRRRRPRYTYRLASIDVIFTAVAEPANVRNARDRRDRRIAVFVFAFGLIVVVVASIGAAYLVKQLVQLTN
jgi:hypothetical protein